MLSLFCTYQTMRQLIDTVNRRLGSLRIEGHLLKHLVAGGSSKKLVSAEYVCFLELLHSRVRTVGRANLIVLNESIVCE